MSTAIRPFTRMLDTVDCFSFRGHEEAFARLGVAVAGRHLGVLTGEVGSGKSALIRRLFRSLDPGFDSTPLKVGTLLGAVDN